MSDELNLVGYRYNILLTVFFIFYLAYVAYFSQFSMTSTY